MKKFNLIHTSDWHLGHQLYRGRRDDEFQAFLQWLLTVMREREVDALLVAGDVFDTAAPPASAQKLYYDFLGQAVKNGCRHIIITAGNHDSPIFLTAPHDLLSNFAIHVIGSADMEYTLLLSDADGDPACIISAVPYLRERDLRRGDAANGDLLPGLRFHYQEAASAVTRLRDMHGSLPAVAMGHLFVAGSDLDGEGERIIQVGNLDKAPRSIFPPEFDYVALGHIHRPQAVGGCETCRYAGAPLAMSFSERAQRKSVTLVTFSSRTPQVEQIPVPQTRKLLRLTGSAAELLAALHELTSADKDVWIEMRHNGADVPGDLANDARQIAEGSRVQVLCVKTGLGEQNLNDIDMSADLSDRTEDQVFQMLLDARNEPEEKRIRLMETFRQLRADYEDSLRSGD